ncbi:MAG: hypothetical protein HRU25_18240, partial [Psychrobium sp.]|nr:hypothetical protein [Psychrobium sp.]
MFKKLAIAAVVSIMLNGCGAEDREYDVLERSKEEVTIKSLDTKSLWMYMPSTGAAPRYAISQRGFFQGTPKLVTLSFDEKNGIVATEVDRDKLAEASDSRWDSDINGAPVLKIPGEFREYRCHENKFKECTNAEELNSDKDREWTDATHFTPDYSQVTSLARDTVDTWYTASNVTETAEPTLDHYEFDAEKGVINIEVTRYFTADPR